MEYLKIIPQNYLTTILGGSQINNVEENTTHPVEIPLLMWHLRFLRVGYFLKTEKETMKFRMKKQQQQIQNKSPDLGQTTRPYNNQQKKRTCRIVDFAVPVDQRVKLKESDKDKYLNLVREFLKNCGTWKWQLYQL